MERCQILLKVTDDWSDMLSTFNYMRKSNEYVDVTLCCCDGGKVSAHKVLLSARSNFFSDLFHDNPCQHSVIILQDVTSADLHAMMELMYLGEATVYESQLISFLSFAKLLNLQGFAINNTYSAPAAEMRICTNPSTHQADDQQLEVSFEEEVLSPANNIMLQLPQKDGPSSLKAKKKKQQSRRKGSSSSQQIKSSESNVMLQRGNDRATEYPHSSGISTSSEGAVTKEIFINLDSDETDSESNETQSVDVTSYVDELLVVDTTTEEVTELLVVHSSSMPHFQTEGQENQEEEEAPPVLVPAEAGPSQHVDSKSSSPPRMRPSRIAGRLMIIKRGAWYYCSLCNNYFNSEARCRAHCKRHQEKKTSCHICKSVYSNKNSLNRHMVKHTARFRCSICEISYDRMSRLKRHHAVAHLKT